MEKKQPSLFDTNKKENEFSPLAHEVRPTSFDEFIGQDDIFLKHPFLFDENFPSFILFGPSGSGKTTLAEIIASRSNKEFFSFNAVLGGVPELKKIIHEAQQKLLYSNKHSVIFIDEIHRFNKTQQDAILPYVETGAFTLIGATTENPKVSINRALLSRTHQVELAPLQTQSIELILESALAKKGHSFPPVLLKIIAEFSDGDARVALNLLEASLKLKTPNEESVKNLIGKSGRAFDKNGDRHYEVISAFIKSMRRNDPQEAILWLAVMIDGGEDPLFIARRLVIFASEDVGNADPGALTLATSALFSISKIGMPEAKIILAQATTYLASTYKSKSAYSAIDEAMLYVENKSTLDSEFFLKEKCPEFYKPTREGKEEGIKRRLDSLK